MACKISFPIILFCLAFFSFSTGDKANQKVISDFMLKDVNQAAFPGAPGPLVAYGENSAPIFGGLSSGVIRTVGAFSENRMVAFGHTGYLYPPLAFDSELLLKRCVQFAANMSKPINEIKIAIHPNGPEMAPLLNQQQISNTIISKEDLKNSGYMANFDAICIKMVPNTIPIQDAQYIKDFLDTGKGIIASSTGWSYGDAMIDLKYQYHPGNFLFADSGIVWTRDFVYPSTNQNSLNTTYSLVQDANLLTNIAIINNYLSKNGNKPPTQNEIKAFDYFRQDASFIPDKFSSIFPQSLLNNLLKKQPVPQETAGVSDSFQKKLLSSFCAVMNSVEYSKIKVHPSAKYFPGSVSLPLFGDIPIINSVPEIIDIAKSTVKNTFNYSNVPDDKFVGKLLPKYSKKLQFKPRSTGKPMIWYSTGLYAEARKEIRVDLLGDNPPVTYFQVGAHTDDLSNSQRDSWFRAPKVSYKKDIPGNLTMASPFGGMIYLLSNFETGNSVSVSIAGAIPAPYFKLNETSDLEWFFARNSGAPWAELATDTIILTIKSSHVKNLDNPGEIMEHWDNIMNSYMDLLSLPRERERPERIVTDVMPSAGYMHSGYPIVTFLDVGFDVWDITQMKKFSYINWGLFHEIGHIHQGSKWSFDGTGEVTCNLFPMYIFNTVYNLPISQTHDALQAKGLKSYLDNFINGGIISYDRWKADPFLALQIYYQLQLEFSWGAYKKVFEIYNSMQANPGSNQAKIDTWIVTWSQVVERNLCDLFKSWGFTVSDTAAASVSNFPNSNLSISVWQQYVNSIQ